jgi:hypothetical protein
MELLSYLLRLSGKTTFFRFHGTCIKKICVFCPDTAMPKQIKTAQREGVVRFEGKNTFLGMRSKGLLPSDPMRSQFNQNTGP